MRFGCRRARGWALCAALVALLPAEQARAQAVERPADERPQIEPPEPGVPEPAPIELPAPPPPPPERDRLAAGLRVVLRDVLVLGSTVFAPDEFRRVTDPYTNREVDTSDIQDLVQAVTAMYIEAGYVSSGATLPDQDLEDAVLRIQVVEARLVDVVVEGNSWYRSAYLRNRLLSTVTTPVNVREVEDQIQLLLQERAVDTVRGELRPGARLGENVLALTMTENLPFGLTLRSANDQPPGVGSVRGQILADSAPLFGYGDALETRFEWSEGLNSQRVRFRQPILFPPGFLPRFLRHGTEARVFFRRTYNEIVERPFNDADIEAKEWSAGLGIAQALLRTPRQQLWLSLTGELRRSTTYLDGSRVSFVPGPKNGRSKLTVMRLAGDWTLRSPSDVFAVRSLLSFGLDVFEATKNTDGEADGDYVAWLVQGQWAHLFSEDLWNTQLLVRADLQLADDPLLSIEQIAVGGVRTVRGYRENQLVRDNALIASAELRIPILGNLLGGDQFDLAPFGDVGRSWNVQGTRGKKTISSAGIGLRYTWRTRISAYFYWAHAFRDFRKNSSNIQDDGFHLGVSVRAF